MSFPLVDNNVSLLNQFGFSDLVAQNPAQPAAPNKLTIPASAVSAVMQLNPSAVSTVGSTAGPDISGLFSAPDQYQQQALNLLQPGPNGEPPSAENVAKAQQLMEAGQLIFQMLSETMKEQSDDAQTAIKAASN